MKALHLLLPLCVTSTASELQLQSITFSIEYDATLINAWRMRTRVNNGSLSLFVYLSVRVTNPLPCKAFLQETSQYS